MVFIIYSLNTNNELLLHCSETDYPRASKSVLLEAKKYVLTEDGPKRAERSVLEKYEDINNDKLEDGLYIVPTKDAVDHYTIYRVKTIILRGWIRNDVTRDISKIIVFSLTTFDGTVSQEVRRTTVKNNNQFEHGQHTAMIEELKDVLKKKDGTPTKDIDAALRDTKESYVVKPKPIVKKFEDKNLSVDTKMKNDVLEELRSRFKKNDIQN